MRSIQGIFLLFSLAFVNSIDLKDDGRKLLNEPTIRLSNKGEFSLYIDEKFIGDGVSSNNTIYFDNSISNPKLIAINSIKNEKYG